MPNSENNYKAFFSYVRQNDQLDNGKFSALRKLIEAEVWVQTAENFELFQDQEDIAWGEDWKERIKKALDSSKFLIAIITPGYLKSEACRFEFEYFFHKMNEFEQKDVILPILYIETQELHRPKDNLTTEMAKREWVDWRDLRFTSLESVKVKKKILSLAIRIRDLMAREKVINVHKKSIAIPNSVITESNQEWQPSFTPSIPAPSSYLPLPRSVSVNEHPSQITILLKSTGNPERDRRRIKALYGTLISFHGQDRFSFQIFDNGKGNLVDFPHDATQISPGLLSILKKLLGEENWHIEEIKNA